MDYQINQIVNVNGERGRVIGRNSATNLFKQTTFWNDILKSGDRIAFVRLDSGKEIYIIFK
jgi:hypothetical protein